MVGQAGGSLARNKIERRSGTGYLMSKRKNMKNKITRRHFIKSSAVFGVSTSIGSSSLAGIFDQSLTQYMNNDVTVTIGTDYFESTQRAIDLLGGMSQFVPKNSRVLLLGNVWRTPGTYTKPDIFRAIACMCRDAGARKITCVSMMEQKNWQQTGNAAALEKEGVELRLFDYKEYSRFSPVAIPGGVILKEAEIIKEVYDHDVLINVPICKDHVDTVFSCTMKNLMGLNSYRNNRKFHIEQAEHGIDIATHLAHCIVDLNTVIVPTLNVVDATEFIVTNGPMGPGKIIKPRKIVAGVDRIAIDAYCIRLLDKNCADVPKILKGYKQGLGEMNLAKVRVHEESI
jgi:uncharacterized protein (DUF362 family)